jgi:NAD(P)H-dependent FMN reductase
MDKLNIGIVLGSTRDGRASAAVGDWVKEQLSDVTDVNFTILDIKEFDLPFLGTTTDTTNIERWNQALAQQDGFIFVVAEYNHSMTGALKNALDLARDPWNNKAAGIVSYGSAGGARAAEHLRTVLGELQIADVRTHVLLSLFDDFKDFSVFAPRSVHKDNLHLLASQVAAWSRALRPLRQS